MSNMSKEMDDIIKEMMKEEDRKIINSLMRMMPSYPKLTDLVSEQPMDAPVGLVFYMKARYVPPKADGLRKLEMNCEIARMINDYFRDRIIKDDSR